jgi:hypothetical protein
MVDTPDLSGLDYLTGIENEPGETQIVVPFINYEFLPQSALFTDPVAKTKIYLDVEDTKFFDPDYGLITVTDAVYTEDLVSYSVTFRWSVDDITNIVDDVINVVNFKNLAAALYTEYGSHTRLIDPEKHSVNFVGFVPYKFFTFACAHRTIPQHGVESIYEKYTDTYGKQNCNHKDASVTDGIFSSCKLKNVHLIGDPQKINSHAGTPICQGFNIGLKNLYKIEDNHYVGEFLTTTGLGVFKIETSEGSNLFDQSEYINLIASDIDVSNLDPIIPTRSESESLVSLLTS